MAGIIGIPGRHQSESMAAFVRNRWPASSESARPPRVRRWRAGQRPAASGQRPAASAVIPG